jgi:hypothetical protein
MTLKPMRLLLALACGSIMPPTFAQTPGQEQQEQQAPQAQAPALGEELMALPAGQLRREIQTRFDRALGFSRDPAVVAADSAAYLWAVEAKVQCGIALGYLKSGFKDPISVGKCATFAAGMNQPRAMARAVGASHRRQALSGQRRGIDAQALADARPGRAAPVAGPAGTDRATPTQTAR